MAVDMEAGAMPLEEQERLIAEFAGTVGDKLEEETPFLAEIGADEITPGKYKGPQWHLAVKPLEFELRGKTGMFHEYYGLSKQLRSKMGAALVGLQEAGVGKGTPVGKGALVGFKCWFVRRDMRFGKGADGTPIVAEQVLLPLRKATEEELSRVGTGEPASTPAAPEWTDEQTAAVITAIEGLKPGEFQKAVLGRGTPASQLPRDLKNAILSGAALEYLTNKGLVILEDGKVAVTV